MRYHLILQIIKGFQFKINTNGIDAQDKKEIAAFMKKARPFIDKFLAEFQKDAANTPVTKMAKDITDIFSSMKEKNEDTKNLIKTNLVKEFDKSFNKLTIPNNSDKQSIMDKLFENAQKLLEKSLEMFDKINSKIYA